MGKRKEKTPAELMDELSRELRNSYDEHADLLVNGCSDPFWPDGANLELVRNHIISCKRQIMGLMEKHPSLKAPKDLRRALPREVDRHYMAPNTPHRPNVLEGIKRDKEFDREMALATRQRTAQKKSGQLVFGW